MSDRKTKTNALKGKAKAKPSVIEMASLESAAPVAFEPAALAETLVAPCATAAAPVEAIELQAAAPIELPEPAPAVNAPAEPPVLAAPETDIQTATNFVQEGTRTMNEQINQTIEQNKAATQEAANRVQAAFGDINERSKTAMEKSAKMMEEMTDLARGNVEALVASSKVAARGAETLTQEAADFNRRSFEATSNALKSFSEVKSPTDFFRLQSEFARGQFDAMVAETSKMSEAMIKLTGEIAEPITSRYSVAADRVKTLAL
jgi:phasin family protein